MSIYHKFDTTTLINFSVGNQSKSLNLDKGNAKPTTTLRYPGYTFSSADVDLSINKVQWISNTSTSDGGYHQYRIFGTAELKGAYDHGNASAIQLANLLQIKGQYNGGSWGIFTSQTKYVSINIIDDVPTIAIKDDIASIAIGADNGESAKIEVSSDQDGQDVYLWKSDDGETTDLRGLPKGQTWLSSDGTVSVTLTDSGFQFALVPQANDEHVSNFNVLASGEALYESDIFHVVNPGADKEHFEIDWAETETQFGHFEVNEDGSWSFVPDPDKIALIAKDDIVTQDLAYTYKDADGSEITGTIRVNLIGQNADIEQTIYPAPLEAILAKEDETIIQSDETQAIPEDSGEPDTPSGDELPEGYSEEPMSLNDADISILDGESEHASENGTHDADGDEVYESAPVIHDIEAQSGEAQEQMTHPDEAILAEANMLMGPQIELADDPVDENDFAQIFDNLKNVDSVESPQSVVEIVLIDCTDLEIDAEEIAALQSSLSLDSQELADEVDEQAAKDETVAETPSTPTEAVDLSETCVPVEPMSQADIALDTNVAELNTAMS